jgi:hypothetical protein
MRHFLPSSRRKPGSSALQPRKDNLAVIPAQARIQWLSHLNKGSLDSGLRRNDEQGG